MTKLSLSVCALLAATSSTFAFTTPSSNARFATSLSAEQDVSRRAAFVQSAAVLAGGMSLLNGSPAFAEVTEETPKVTTRMGGFLEKYQDSRGWTILAPSGWNKFEGEPGAYDVKWQDVVDNKENVKVSSNPVKSTTTSIDVLGDVQALGENLAKKRNGKLVRAQERQTEGILFYTFDFALSDNTHQLLVLCVNKGKIWSLDANSSEKRWGKREEMYYNILGSFMPKLS